MGGAAGTERRGPHAWGHGARLESLASLRASVSHLGAGAAPSVLRQGAPRSPGVRG